MAMPRAELTSARRVRYFTETIGRRTRRGRRITCSQLARLRWQITSAAVILRHAAFATWVRKMNGTSASLAHEDPADSAAVSDLAARATGIRLLSAADIWSS